MKTTKEPNLDRFYHYAGGGEGGKIQQARNNFPQNVNQNSTFLDTKLNHKTQLSRNSDSSSSDAHRLVCSLWEAFFFEPASSTWSKKKKSVNDLPCTVLAFKGLRIFAGKALKG